MRDRGPSLLTLSLSKGAERFAERERNGPVE